MTTPPDPSTLKIAGVVALVLVTIVAALLGYIEFRERREQVARNEALDAKREAAHAEAERDAAIATDDELTRRLREDLGAGDIPSRDGRKS